ncbi:restriction endonuclease subunit S [Methyloprofundus sp.]|uniref:restriction endonuclease subunit S n=1 Tax=Methyloprofundus sp. TaxID=2020875 RepID=UPI003D15244F
MKYLAYKEYKDSGVDWLGEIPNHWMSTELKRYSVVQGGYAFSSDSFIDAGKAVIRIGDIKQDGSVSLESCKYIKIENADQYSQYQVNNGDLLMAMTGATIGKAGWFKENEPALLNQRVGSFKCNRIYLNYKFFWYVLNSSGYQEYIKITAFGGAQPNISDSGMVGYQSAFPRENEQTKIASFLDHETAKIDTLIEKQQQLIKLLKEKRQAVISHAVTKGLNPNASMRDSGVEWLGEVPEHWEAVPLKYLCNFSGGGTPSKDNLSYWTGGDIPWVSPKDMKSFWVSDTQDKLTDTAVKESSTNFVDCGALLMVVRSGILQRTIPIAINTVRVTLNQDMKALKFNSRLNVEYAANYILGNVGSLLLEWSKEGATVESIEQEYLSNSIFPVPPIEEQIEINESIKLQMDIFQDVEIRAIRGISLLQERRTALISAAVTGKIDVRNWQAPEPSHRNKETQQEATA